MATSGAQTGPGFALQVSDSGGSTYTTLAYCKAIKLNGVETVFAALLNQDSPNRTEEFQPSENKAPTLSTTIVWSPANASQQNTITVIQSQGLRNFKVYHTTNTTNYATFAGYFAKVSNINLPEGGSSPATADIEIQGTGPITFS